MTHLIVIFLLFFKKILFISFYFGDMRYYSDRNIILKNKDRENDMLYNFVQ